MNNSIIDGGQVGNFAVGGSVALIAIAMVFAILLAIIAICEITGRMTSKLIKENKKAETEVKPQVVTPITKSVNKLDPNDEDAMVACLIASIEMRNEIKKDVKVLSVRKVG